jgi:hypothetical protein
MGSTLRYIVTRVFKFAAYGLFCFAVLGWIAENSGERKVDVVLHVLEPNVEIEVGPRRLVISEQPRNPISLTLRPGSHVLRVTRYGHRLLEESFEVGRGQNVVLAAYDQSKSSNAAAT